jgi:hypothetical protein
MSPALPLTVNIAEDGRFCSHHGVDLTRSARRSQADDFDEMRGGSTITQQLAKNLFFWQGRSYVRKALEFRWRWIDHIAEAASWNLPQCRAVGPNGDSALRPARACIRQVGK